jgi:hypothetical protein
LDLNKTFDEQWKSVNKHIIPVIQKSINRKVFPVSDTIIKHIIHERHRHQRENLMNKDRGDEWNDLEKRRKHGNSRRNEVSKALVVYFILLNEKSKNTE